LVNIIQAESPEVGYFSCNEITALDVNNLCRKASMTRWRPRKLPWCGMIMIVRYNMSGS